MSILCVCVYLTFISIVFCGTGEKKGLANNKTVSKDTASYLCLHRTGCSLHVVLHIIKTWACA